jgi:hypothetical protein
MKHFLLLFILTGLLFSQDTTIVLENGRTLKGTIISETDSTYRIMGESWRVTDGVYEVFNTFINISKNETVEEKELSKQDVLLHKSGKNYKGTFLGKVDEKIIFKIEGEKSNSAFSINDVDIVITSRGGIKVELYYPFDIETIIEEDKSEYRKRFEAVVTGNMDEYLKQNPRNTPPCGYAISFGMLLWFLIAIVENPPM